MGHNSRFNEEDKFEHTGLGSEKAESWCRKALESLIIRRLKSKEKPTPLDFEIQRQLV